MMMDLGENIDMCINAPIWLLLLPNIGGAPKGLEGTFHGLAVSCRSQRMRSVSFMSGDSTQKPHRSS
jgi:hypothetical protein